MNSFKNIVYQILKEADKPLQVKNKSYKNLIILKYVNKNYQHSN